MANPPYPGAGQLYLAFLPHLCDFQGVPGLSDVTKDIFRPPSGFLTPDGVVTDDRLQGHVNDLVLNDTDLQKLRFALVDLTDPVPNPGKPSKTEVKGVGNKLCLPEVAGVAGNKLTDQGGLGSMAKVACMYAAFQLKFDLECLAKQARPKSIGELFDLSKGQFNKNWKERQKPDSGHVKLLHASNPKIELYGSLVKINGEAVKLPPHADYPDLFQIFENPLQSPALDADGRSRLRFKGSNLIPITDPGAAPSPPSAAVADYAKLDPEELLPLNIALEKAFRLTFWERLWLMIDESNNPCAQSCIQNVGFLYIASLLWQSDLFSPDRGGGLWEGDGHNKDKKGALLWTPNPVPWKAPGIITEDHDYITGTAASIAAFLTALAQGRLINMESCRAMRQLMDKGKTAATVGTTSFQGSFTRSYFAEGLAPPPRPDGQLIDMPPAIWTDTIQSKLGIGTNNSDCALITRKTQGGNTLRYVAAGFDEPKNSDGKLLGKLIVQLDKCIQRNNGL
jgi:hypothetical protein